MTTPATHFAEREHLICSVSRLIEENKSYWVGGGGEPLYTILLAQRLYTPGVQYFTEDSRHKRGAITPTGKSPVTQRPSGVRTPYQRSLTWSKCSFALYCATLRARSFVVRRPIARTTA